MIATLRIEPEQYFRLSLVPWETYVAISDGMGERHVRVTFDRGELEIMSPSPKHEREKSRLRRLTELLTLELDMDIVGAGSMTCRNEEMQRALEPDECYWIANEASVRDHDPIDLDVDPPPDLAMEIEVSRSALDRMGIYATLKVPEVWHWDGETLSIHWLTSRGAYRTSKRSKAFPFLPIDAFTEFLTRTDLSETKLLREFRTWIRKHRAEWGR